MPPTAAAIVHAQAAIQPSPAPNVVRLIVFAFAFAGCDSIDNAFCPNSHSDGTRVHGSLSLHCFGRKGEHVDQQGSTN